MEISRASGALPEMKNRTLPPNRAWSFLCTSRCATACLNASSGPGRLPSCRSAATSPPTAIPHWKILNLRGPFSLAPETALLRTFSKMRGTPARKVGRICPRFSTSFSTRPSTAVQKPIRSCAASSTLPRECASGTQRYWRSSMDRMPSASMDSPSNTQQSWVSSTPLGWPVVPEV